MPCPSDGIFFFFAAFKGGAGHKHRALAMTWLERGKAPAGGGWGYLGVFTRLMSLASVICWWSCAKMCCAAPVVALGSRLMGLLRTALLMHPEIKFF